MPINCVIITITGKTCWSNRLKYKQYKLVSHTVEHWKGIPHRPFTVNPILRCPDNMDALKVLLSEFFIFLVVKNLLFALEACNNCPSIEGLLSVID